ncbi:MAG: NB-ARC domain-containing protein, partial [Actinomycetota bacterium]
YGRGFQFVATLDESADPAGGQTAATLLIADAAGRGTVDGRRSMLDGLVAAAGGRTLPGREDVVLAAFDDPAAAVRTAVAVGDESIDGVDGADRELGDDDVGAGRRSGLRVALHHDRLPADDDLPTSSALCVAEAVLAATNPGQIVATVEVVDACGAAMPEGVDAQIAGAFALPGVGPNVPLARVVAADGHATMAEPQPLRAERGTSTNVPPQRTWLVGRERELDEVVDRLGSTDLVTIVGPGGAGKTTLAVEVARRSTRRFTGGVWLCELASVPTGSVASALLDAIDQNAGSGQATIDGIVERLGSAPTLLVLDNCEHVIDEVAVLVPDLLAASSTVTVLATSREPLDVRPEQTVRIDGLAHDAVDGGAVELFARRLADVAPLDRSPDARSTMRRIVERLDGLPLAIELAAPRVASLTLTELLASLDDQLAILTSRTGDGRQSAMEDTIAWSFGLLDDEERRLVTELTVFAGPFTLEAASAVSTIDSPYLVVHRLVERSMVTRVESRFGSRFRLLEPIRQFAERQLEPEIEPELRHAHAEYFAARAGQLGADLWSSSEPAAAAALTDEWQDLGRALRWGRDQRRADVAVDPLVALDVHLLWQLRMEGFGWLVEAASVFDHLGARAEALLTLAAWSRGDLDEAEERSGRLAGDKPPASLSVARFGLALARDDFAAAAEAARDIEHAVGEAGQSSRLLTASNYELAAVLLADPASRQVDELIEEVDDLVELGQWPTGRAMTLGSHLLRCVRTGEVEHMPRFRSELERACAEGAAPYFAYIATGLADPSSDQADPQSDLDLAVRSLRSLQDADDHVQLPAITRGVVIALAGVGHIEAAATLAGYVAGIRGVGAGGHFSPGYDDVLDTIAGELGDDRFAALGRRGGRLDLAGALRLVDALDRPGSNGTSSR